MDFYRKKVESWSFSGVNNSGIIWNVAGLISL